MDPLRRPLAAWFLAFALLLGAAGCGDRWRGESLERPDDQEEENGENGEEEDLIDDPLGGDEGDAEEDDEQDG